MRRLLAGLLMLFVLGSVLWLGAARGAQHLLVQAARDTTNPFFAEAVTTSGYPGTISLNLIAPEWRDPQGWSWLAPQAEAQLDLLAPTRLRLLLPPRQEVTVGGQSLPLLSRNLRVEASIAANTSLSFRDFSAEAQRLELTGLLTSGQVGVRFAQSDSSGRVGFQIAVDELRADSALTVPLPAQLRQAPATLRAKGTLRLSQPLDRHSTDRPPLLTGLTLEHGEFRLGGSVIGTSGRLRADEQGRAAGRLLIAIRGWRGLLPLLVEFGVIRADVLPAVENAAARLAQPDPAAGPDGRLSLPLAFADGQVSLGPFPLGAAPRFY